MTPSTNAELVCVIPTLGRPLAIEPLIDRFAATTENHRLLFVVRADDKQVVRRIARYSDRDDVDLLLEGNLYPLAINAGIEASTEPYIFVGADDVKPHAGWFEAAKSYMNDKVGFVSLNDLGNPQVMRGDYATLPLVSRRYAESLDGPLYFEGYQHVGCDVDASLEAKKRGAFAYAEDAVMEHMHPDWGKGRRDQTYKVGGMNRDKRVHDREVLDSRWPGRWVEIMSR